VHAVIEELRVTLPPVWAGTRTGELMGNSIAWGTIQNLRARRAIPDSCFLRSGPRVLVLRDEFLRWWESRLSEARRSPIIPPRRGRRRDRADESAPLPRRDAIQRMHPGALDGEGAP
jgi:hypothetical protein